MCIAPVGDRHVGGRTRKSGESHLSEMDDSPDGDCCADVIAYAHPFGETTAIVLLSDRRVAFVSRFAIENTPQKRRQKHHSPILSISPATIGFTFLHLFCMPGHLCSRTQLDVCMLRVDLLYATYYLQLTEYFSYDTLLILLRR
jgi:hypothetical protein